MSTYVKFIYIRYEHFLLFYLFICFGENRGWASDAAMMYNRM